MKNSLTWFYLKIQKPYIYRLTHERFIELKKSDHITTLRIRLFSYRFSKVFTALIYRYHHILFRNFNLDSCSLTKLLKLQECLTPQQE